MWKRMEGSERKKKGARLPGAVKNSNTSILILILIIIIIIGITAVPAFKNPDNIMNILRNGSIVGIVALGATFVLLIGQIDLSVGSILSLSAVVGGIAMGKNDVAGFIVTLAVGLGLGVLNGVIVAKAKIPSFMVTLGMMSVYSGIANIIVHGQSAYLYNAPLYQWLCKGTLIGLPFPVILLVILTAILAVILRFTKLGHDIYYIGANPTAGIYSGIYADRIKIIMYAVSGGLAALAGPILCAQTNRITTTIGSGYELSAISVAVLGGTILDGGKGSVVGTLIGAAIFAVLLNILALSGIGTYMELVLRGLILIVIVAAFERIRNGGIRCPKQKE